MEVLRIELKLITRKVTVLPLNHTPPPFINILFYNNKTILQLALCYFFFQYKEQ